MSYIPLDIRRDIDTTVEDGTEKLEEIVINPVKYKSELFTAVKQSQVTSEPSCVLAGFYLYRISFVTSHTGKIFDVNPILSGILIWTKIIQNQISSGPSFVTGALLV